MPQSWEDPNLIKEYQSERKKMYEHSNCHNAPVSLGGEDTDQDIGGQGEAVTRYWVCTKCDQPCDTH